MKPLPLLSFGGYRRFCAPWWRDLAWWLTRGWVGDLATFYHRGRYGWAPRDTWSFDDYLARVMAGGLGQLAKTTHGTPCGYPHYGHELPTDFDPFAEPDHEQWSADLQRWSTVCKEYAERWDLPYDPPDYTVRRAEEERRIDAMRATLVELTPWFGSLWD